jgi:hypothetical protein
MAFLSGVNLLTGSHCKLRPNTEGTVLGLRQNSTPEDVVGSHACCGRGQAAVAQ